MSTISTEITSRQYKTQPVKRWKVNADPRIVSRNIVSSIQGNWLTAVVELTLNAKDAYDRAGIENGNIVIKYSRDHKNKKRPIGRVAIIDFAQGMTVDTIQSKFKKYGSEISEMTVEDKIRGILGKGVTDSLGSMEKGCLHCIKDDTYSLFTVEYDTKEKEFYYSLETSDNKKIVKSIRKDFGFKENGVAATFILSADNQFMPGLTVPHFPTFKKDVSTCFMLRHLFIDPNYNVVVVDENTGKKYTPKYRFPKGIPVAHEEFEVTNGDISYNVTMELLQAKEPLLQKKGYDREGGLLVVDEQNNVLDLTLYKYNNDCYADALYGRLVLGNFREHIKNGYTLISDARDGLQYRHPLNLALQEKVEEILAKFIKNEQVRRERDSKVIIESSQKKKEKRALPLLDYMYRKELSKIDYKFEERTEKLKDDYYPEPNGYCFRKKNYVVSEESTTILELCLDVNKFKAGTLIHLAINDDGEGVVELESSPVQKITEENVKRKNKKNTISKKIKVKGIIPDREVGIIATFLDKKTEYKALAKIYVQPDEGLMNEGLGFRPESVIIREGKEKKVDLLINAHRFKVGDVIFLTFEKEEDEEFFVVSPDKIIIDKSLANKHNIIKIEITIEGSSIGESTIIYARCEEQNSEAMVMATVSNVKKKTKKVYPNIFNETQFDTRSNPEQASCYRDEEKCIVIFTQFPTNKLYFGIDQEKEGTEKAQVYYADLWIDTFFNAIAQDLGKKSRDHELLISIDQLPEAIQMKKNELLKLYGAEIHRAFVDNL